MAVQYAITTGNVALAAGTAKTVIETTASANVPPEWIELDVSNDATSGTVLVEVGSITATGTGTTYASKRWGQAVGVAATTAKINDTVEPAGFSAIIAWRLPYSSPLIMQWPLGRELLQATSALYAVRLTASVACNAVANLVIEE